MSVDAPVWTRWEDDPFPTYRLKLDGPEGPVMFTMQPVKFLGWRASHYCFGVAVSVAHHKTITEARVWCEDRARQIGGWQ